MEDIGPSDTLHSRYSILRNGMSTLSERWNLVNFVGIRISQLSSAQLSRRPHVEHTRFVDRYAKQENSI